MSAEDQEREIESVERFLPEYFNKCVQGMAKEPEKEQFQKQAHEMGFTDSDLDMIVSAQYDNPNRDRWPVIAAHAGSMLACKKAGIGTAALAYNVHKKMICVIG